jgi:hypothetical protein
LRYIFPLVPESEAALMLAGYYNFTIESGATFTKTLTWKIDDVPVNLYGYTARLKAAMTPKANYLMELTTENGGITLGGEAGTITLSISASGTDKLRTGKYVYDLELVSQSTVTRLVQGEITVSANVTK